MATRQRDEITRGFFAAMGSSNGAAMADYMTESVRWWFPQSAAERGAADPLSDVPKTRAQSLLHVHFADEAEAGFHFRREEGGLYGSQEARQR